MARKQNRYREMERILTIALIADAAVFLLYLLAAGFGVIWLKVITAIVAIVGSGLCLALLYFSGELLRRRSLWMSVGFAAVVVCLLVSLLLNYPSPNKAKAMEKTDTKQTGSAVGAMILDYNIDN